MQRRPPRAGSAFLPRSRNGDARTMSSPGSIGSVSAALAKDRLGVPAVVFFILSAVAPLTVVAGVVTTLYAVTGLIAIGAAFLVVAVILAVFSAGYVAMARR